MRERSGGIKATSAQHSSSPLLNRPQHNSGLYNRYSESLPVLTNSDLYSNQYDDEQSDEDGGFDIDITMNEECVNRVGKPVTTSDKDYELMNVIQRAHRRGNGLNYYNNDINENVHRVAQVTTLHAEDFLVDESYHFRDSSYEVKMYCPGVFQQIRAFLEVDELSYYHALNGLKGAFTKIGTPGKSGAFFFFTPTMQYILKSVTEEELDTLLELLPNYFRHIETRKKKTLLSSFYSLFEVIQTTTMKVIQHFRFVVMNNVFFTNKIIHKRYDLKGSTAGRQASEKELKKNNPILKDNDIREGDIHMFPSLKHKFFQRLVADIRFLKENDIIDYSLLLGVHKVPNEERRVLLEAPPDNTDFFGAYYHVCYSDDYAEMYFMGIIDILQRYNNRKQIEKALKTGMSALKSKLSKRNKEKVSVQKPFKYSRRFEQFMKITCSNVKMDDYPIGSRRSYRLGNTDLIEEFYHKHVWHNGLDHKVYLYRGLMYFGILKWDEMSRFDFSKSITINGGYSNVMSYLMRGLTFERMNDPEAAINDYNTLIKLNLFCADAYLLRGCLYHEYYKNLDQAERDYNKYLEINPYEADPYGLKKTLKMLGIDPIDAQIQKALLMRDRDVHNGNRTLEIELNRIIEANAKHSYYVYFLRALLRKDPKMAIEDYTKCLELNPRHAESYFNRAQLQKNVDPDWAESDFCNAIKYRFDYLEAYYNRAMLAKSRGETHKAIQDLDKCVDIYEHLKFASVSTANRHTILHRELQLGLPPSSIAQVPVPTSQPSLSSSPNGLSSLLDRPFQTNHNAEVHNRFSPNGGYFARDGVVVMVDDHTIMAQAYTLRGNIYAELKNFVEAEADYLRAITVDPRFTRSYHYLIQLYHSELQDFAKAKFYLTKLKEIVNKNQKENRLEDPFTKAFIDNMSSEYVQSPRRRYK
jgi:tetratricopeptide (TPR) repeat protein